MAYCVVVTLWHVLLSNFVYINKWNKWKLQVWTKALNEIQRCERWTIGWVWPWLRKWDQLSNSHKKYFKFFLKVCWENVKSYIKYQLFSKLRMFQDYCHGMAVFNPLCHGYVIYYMGDQFRSRSAGKTLLLFFLCKRKSGCYGNMLYDIDFTLLFSCIIIKVLYNEHKLLTLEEVSVFCKLWLFLFNNFCNNYVCTIGPILTVTH